MLIPRRVKHRKQHHPDRSGAAKGGTKLAFGEYGLVFPLLIPAIGAVTARCRGILLGRRTYDIFAAYWPAQVGGPDDAGQGVWIPTTAPEQLGVEWARWFGTDAATLAAVFPRAGQFDRLAGWA